MLSARFRRAVNCVAVVLVVGGVLLTSSASASAGILDATWIAPTSNSDGSPLTDLASYRVYYGLTSSPCSGPSFFPVASSTSSPAANQSVSFRLTGLTAGSTYYVAVTAVNTSSLESPCSPTATAVARAEFDVSPSGSVSFGSVSVGGSTDRTFTVSNMAGGSVSGSAAVAAPFSIVSGSPFTLDGVGATQAVIVRFTPTATTTVSATVTFAANGETMTRVVTGTGGSGGGGGIDTTKPAISISSPTSNPTYMTRNASLTLQGTASDNVGVTQVTWMNDRGGSGTATGTTSWSAPEIVLQTGTNVLTVTAVDAAGNTGTATLTVTSWRRR